MSLKKELERELLHSFSVLCRDFPCGELEEDRESPDFVVVTKEKRIGIEIARIYKTEGSEKNSAQAIEATKDAITIAASNYAKKLGLPPADVALFFTLHRSLNKLSAEDIARRVTETVRINMPLDGQSAKIEYSKGRKQGQPREVDLILINRRFSSDGHEWDWHEMGFVQSDAIRLFEEKIKEKSTRLNDYLRHCDECWLLIVAPSFRPSGMIHPDADSLSRRYNSPFGRTYFLDFGKGRLAQLS
jgi:hypothetical protein